MSGRKEPTPPPADQVKPQPPPAPPPKRTLIEAERQDAMGAQIERLVKAGRVVEFYPVVPPKKRRRVECLILDVRPDRFHPEGRFYAEDGATCESEGQGETCADALAEAMEDVEL